jgi:CheY-like chemotaxis protein
VTTVVLIVEDEQPIRELVQGLLADEGCGVLGAPNGAVALE